MFGLTTLGIYAGIALSGFVSLQNAQGAIDRQGSSTSSIRPSPLGICSELDIRRGGLPLIQIEDRIGVSAPSMLRRTLGCTGFTRWASQPACMDWL